MTETFNPHGRICKRCGVFKLAANLVQAASCAGGVRPFCKECKSAAERERFVSDDKHRARVAAWRARNQDRMKALHKSGHRRNAEKRNAYCRAYRQANLEGMRARGRAWAKDNPERANEINAARRAAKMRATPSWGKSEFERLVISEAYRLAQLRTAMTGIEWHVDHIVPLRSDRVCGFHCASNLQVIPASINHSKNNLVWPGMSQP